MQQNSIQNDEKRKTKQKNILGEECGINHLTTDNMIYDCLRRAQPYDELLDAFRIKYMDKSFANSVKSQEKNQIFVVRQESTLLTKNYDSQEFEAIIQVYIVLREYDGVMAQRILKTMYKDIMHHIVNDDVGEYIELESFSFEYEEPGVLTMGIMTFNAKELENFEYDYDPDPIRIALGLRTSIEGRNEKVFKMKPKEVKNG